MTVKELIYELLAVPQEATVVVSVPGDVITDDKVVADPDFIHCGKRCVFVGNA